MIRCALLLVVIAPALQEQGGGKPPPVPPLAPALPSGTSAAPVDPAIAALVPGALPKDAAPAAREDWQRIEAATCVPGAARAPIRAFELGLDVRYRKSATGGSNDLAAVYKFLAPGCVRIDLKDRSTMRGPAGDWLEDRKLDQNVDLRVAREHAEDRRQLDVTLSVAKHFVALSHPGSLRIASLEKLAAPPGALPKPLEKRSQELAWLRIRSPDFHLVGAGASSAMSRATIGFDPKTARVEIALVEEDRPTAELAPTARVVQLAETIEAQGYVVPKRIYVYSIEEGAQPPAFPALPGMDLFVVRANLAPALRPTDFQPR